jgi:hypothetical protein
MKNKSKFSSQNTESLIPVSKANEIKTTKMRKITSEEPLTLDDLNGMESELPFTRGIVPNSPEGVYMTDKRIGDPLLWVAKCGRINDWAIYIHWEENGETYVLNHGDKVRYREHIKKLVPCTDEAFKKYRQ